MFFRVQVQHHGSRHNVGAALLNRLFGEPGQQADRSPVHEGVTPLPANRRYPGGVGETFADYLHRPC